MRVPAIGRLGEQTGPRGGSLTRNFAFEARHDIFLLATPPTSQAPVLLTPRRARGFAFCVLRTPSLREGNWSLHEDLHLDFELRTLAS